MDKNLENIMAFTLQSPLVTCSGKINNYILSPGEIQILNGRKCRELLLLHFK